jgi:hypothetical protein
MRTPIQKFAKREDVSVRFLYKERDAGRLTLTKVGSRTFVDDADAEQWRALATKVTGTAGDAAMQAVEQKLEQLGKVVAAGRLDRHHVVARLAAVTEKAGLTLQAAA